jgi:hypothetical protein
MYITAKYDVKRGYGAVIADNVCRNLPGAFETLPKTLQGTVEEWNLRIQDLSALSIFNVPRTR